MRRVRPAGQETELIPRATLFGNPDRLSPTVSPDGSQVAFVAPVDGVMNLWVGPADDLAEAAPSTFDGDRGIRNYFWAYDGRHLLYLQDRGGDENWRLYGVALDTREVRDFTPFDGVQAQVLAVRQGFPHEIIVALNLTDRRRHDTYRLDLRTGELHELDENPGFSKWIVDSALVVRGATRFRPDARMEVLVRDSPDDEWRVVLTVEPEEATQSEVLGFTGDNAALYMLTAKDAETTRLMRLDLWSGQLEVVVEDDRHDIDHRCEVAGVTVHPHTQQVQMVALATDRVRRVILDPEITSDVSFLEQLAPGALRLESRDAADARWIVSFIRDDGPITYYLYDRSSRSARFLFHHRSDLARCQLAAMEPIAFRARDGLEISGYATFPVGLPRRNLPTVLRVHGGPWYRDAWGLNTEVQWLANRGYLVIQVNYRGSTGYGKQFLAAGDGEWGRKMLDDLLDAVDWAVSEGFADPDRVGIFGLSYGGYAALCAAAFSPDVFRCAVDICGAANLATMLASFPPYWANTGLRHFERSIGKLDRDAEQIWERSPLSKADQIRIPLLVAQGANDPRVTQAESEQIVNAARANGVECEYLLFPDEGHGFVKPQNRERFYAAAERFLAQHLGGRAEAP